MRHPLFRGPEDRLIFGTVVIAAGIGAAALHWIWNQLVAFGAWLGLLIWGPR